jgi:hypothetical protein
MRTTLTINRDDKLTIKRLCVDYDCTQYKLIHTLLKLVKDYKPELKEMLK